MVVLDAARNCRRGWCSNGRRCRDTSGTGVVEHFGLRAGSDAAGDSALVRGAIIIIAATLLTVAACKTAKAPTDFGINLTVSVDTLSVSDRARIAQMIVTIRGVETGSKTFDVSS